MNKIEQFTRITTKAGTSMGAKLGWQHRLAGRLGKVIGATHGGVVGATLGQSVAGPIGALLGFGVGSRTGAAIGGRVGTRVSLGFSKVKTANKKIIAAGAKLAARGFKKSAEQKYGSTYRAAKGALSKLKLGGSRNKKIAMVRGKPVPAMSVVRGQPVLNKEASMKTSSKAMLGQGLSLTEMVDNVRRALSVQLPKAQGKDWSDHYIREIYTDNAIIETPTGNKLAGYEPDENKGFCLQPESEWKDVVQVWMPTTKEHQWAVTEKAGTSAGVKKAWAARMRGAGGKLNKATSSGFHHSAGKVAGKVARGGLKVLNRANQDNIRGIAKAGKFALGVGKGVAKRSAKHIVNTARNSARFTRGFGEGLTGKETVSFSVKQVGDELRWFAVSSTAFIDKDRQIVTTAALHQDVALSESLKETQGDYGPLRYWHVGIPGGVGLDIGRCDFRMVIGRSLVESGTFVTKAIAERAKEISDELALSIGFRHPVTEPGDDGLFHNTLTLERSLLPSSKESNLLTTFAVS